MKRVLSYFVELITSMIKKIEKSKWSVSIVTIVVSLFFVMAADIARTLMYVLVEVFPIVTSEFRITVILQVQSIAAVCINFTHKATFIGSITKMNLNNGFILND